MLNCLDRGVPRVPSTPARGSRSSPARRRGAARRRRPPLEPLADVAAAVAEALRYPLAGPPLDVLARGGPRDRRRAASGAAAAGSRTTRARRARRRARRARPARVRPDARRCSSPAGSAARRSPRARGAAAPRPGARLPRPVVVHDCEAETTCRSSASATGRCGPSRARRHRPRRHGRRSRDRSPRRPAALLDACAAGDPRGGATHRSSSPPARRLAARRRARGRLRATTCRSSGSRSCSTIPGRRGLYRGYPWDHEPPRGSPRSPPPILNACPPRFGGELLTRDRRLNVVAALAGPRVAHAEALVRGTRSRCGRSTGRSTRSSSRSVGERHRPAEPLNPITAPRSGSATSSGSGASARRSPRAAPSSSSTRSAASWRTSAAAVPRAVRSAPRARRRRLGRRASARGRDRRALAAYRTAPHRTRDCRLPTGTRARPCSRARAG